MFTYAEQSDSDRKIVIDSSGDCYMLDNQNNRIDNPKDEVFIRIAQLYDSLELKHITFERS